MASTLTPESDGYVTPILIGRQKRLDPAQLQALASLAEVVWNEAMKVEETIAHDRRDAKRQYLGTTIIVTPCLDTENPRIRDSEVVLAKDISDTGLSYLCTRPPHESQILITFPMEDRMPACLLAEVRYSHPTKRGKYVVGVRFHERVHLVDLEIYGQNESVEDDDEFWARQ